MAFSKVEALPDFPALEAEILDLWRDKDVFHRSLLESQDRPSFVFYEGPPTANGMPHNGHVLTRVMKDIWPRYRTMRGYHVERWAGWDTHGLPVEVEVEKELRISGKAAIVEYGVEAFVKRCLESVFRYTEQWEDLTTRIGFWVDLEKAYVTYHKSYVESVWWALSKLFEKGLLYKGHKVVWWWAQGGTALSSGETGNAYRTVDDPSVYVRFPLVDEDASLVVWTTTPWTLPSNMFAAVNGELEYSYVRDPETGHTLIVAEGLRAALSEKLGRALELVKTVKGETLYGKRYKPPFSTFEAEVGADPRYFRVVPGDKATSGPAQWFVSLDAGTGIVHLAPAFGEDDWKVWRGLVRQDGEIPLLCAVGPDGKLTDVMGELAGTWVKDADKPLQRRLKEAGLLVHGDVYRHEYPFCWRAENDPLIQYARDAWFIRTTSVIDRVMDNNQAVEWLPSHIKDGRFGDFLANNVDWALSRERFWGTPLNIWECPSCQHAVAPGSVADIEARNPAAFQHFFEAQKKDPSLSEHLLVHKPWIDQVSFACEKCGENMRRVPDVIDCWFDSGCMPFAQFGYPWQEGSEARFKEAFPADFISEAIDQTRGWFYSLMMVSSLLFEDAELPHPYKRCIVLGHVSDKHGKKESKSSGNYTPPMIILDRVRMEFAPVEVEGVTAKPGEVLIGRDDLDGLDAQEGASFAVYRKDREAEGGRTLVVRAHKKLPRRVAVLSPEDLEALGLELAPADTRPAEVPGLPAARRVVLEDRGTPAPGADAFRWFFYASNPPWSNTRHSLGNVRGLQKELPIKLRSVYAFFVTYANIDDFDPVKDEKSRRKVKERALLDRWIISELEKTKKKVVEHMDAFRSFDAAQTLNGFVEALSNWYVRRSRSRFWAAGRDQDKLDAFWTLYQCLRDLALLTAPFTPFQAEGLYQNLVVGPFGKSAPESVHLSSYPTADASLVDEGLSATMAVLRELVSLGLKVRTDQKIRVRQPLSEVELILSDPRLEEALSPYIDIMKEELNVKRVQFASKADAYCDFQVKPNFAALGKRLGPKMKVVQAQLGAMDPGGLKAALDREGRIDLELDDGSVSLSSEEVVVQVVAKEGFAAAGSSVGVVVLDTKIDEALLDEGRFREVLARVQGLRKDLALDFAARIKLALRGAPEIMKSVESRVDTLKSETLAEEVAFGSSLGAEARAFAIDGLELELELIAIGNGKNSGG